jgi:peptidoglycan/xylan/chitin deacetylase (PgdA/CDA1 family)
MITMIHGARRLGAWLLLLGLLTACGSVAGGMTPALLRTGSSPQARPVPTGLGGRVWDTIPVSAKVVALTFDAGANADGVSSIVHTLSRNHVPGTFFLTGNFTNAFGSQAKQLAASGRVGDHSVSHPYFTKLTDAQIRQQVLGAERTITTVTGADPWPWFRFPYGDYNAHTISVVNSVGFVPIGWTVDTLGWEGTSGGITVAKVVARVLASLKPGEIVLMHCGSNPTDHSTLDADALPTIIKDLRARGYSFVTIDALRGLGYQVLTSGGGVHSFGAPGYGSSSLAAGVIGAALAADLATGGYWLLKSDGGVDHYNAPWYGSLRGKIPPGQRVTGIAGGTGNGYWILTSGGGVYAFGSPGQGSVPGKLPASVKAAGIATDRATGGYWVLKSDGGIDHYNAPWYGSLRGRIPAGVTVTAIAASTGKGYWILTSDGSV